MFNISLKNEKLRWIGISSIAVAFAFLLFKLNQKKKEKEEMVKQKKEESDLNDDNLVVRTCQSNFSEYYFDKQQEIKIIV
jgi:hypothetical protein